MIIFTEGIQHYVCLTICISADRMNCCVGLRKVGEIKVHSSGKARPAEKGKMEINQTG